MEMDKESGELGQTSATGAAVGDSPETVEVNVRGVRDDDSNRSTVQTSDQDSEDDTDASLNESRETMERVEMEEACKEIKTHPRTKRRKSSVVFAFFPGRRDSMTPLVLTVSRSQHAHMQHQFGTLQPSSVIGGPVNTGEADSLQEEELDDMELMNSSDQVQLIHQDSEESALDRNDSIGSKFVYKLKKFKHSAILSLKDLKYFMR